MTDTLFDTLSKQVQLKRLERKRMIARQVVVLAELRPFYVRHLRFVEDEGDSLWLRALVRECKRCNSNFKSLMGMVNMPDFEFDKFFEFAQRCSLLAGIDLCTSTQQDFWKAYKQADCERCAMGFKAHSLSQVVLLTPFPISLCHELAHMEDVAYAHFVTPMWESLDDFIPVSRDAKNPVGY